MKPPGSSYHTQANLSPSSEDFQIGPHIRAKSLIVVLILAFRKRNEEAFSCGLVLVGLTKK